MIIFRLLPLICALLFTLSRKTIIKVTKSDTVTVKINFNIFAIVLSEEKIRKRSLRNIPATIRSLKSTLRPLDYLVSKSNVRIVEYDQIIQDALHNAYFSFATLIIISYLQSNAKFISITNKERQPEDANIFIELFFSLSLWHLIISLLFFLYYIVKNKIKRVIQNV